MKKCGTTVKEHILDTFCTEKNIALDVSFAQNFKDTLEAYKEIYVGFSTQNIQHEIDHINSVFI